MSTRPNILLVMTDHQRGETVLPQHPCLLPNVKKLATEGLRFNQVYCPSPHCCPSRATFFTGMYPSRHGVWNNICNRQRLSRGVPKDMRMWSQDLADAGYQLHFSGKWHVSIDETPKDRGWIEHFASGTQPNEHGTTWERLGANANRPLPTTRGEGQIIRQGYGMWPAYGVRTPNANDHDEKTLALAHEAIRTASRQPDPWCVWCGLIGPHDPYHVPAKYLDMYKLDDVPLPPSYSDNLLDKPNIYRKMATHIFGQLSPREVRETIRHYWAYCTYLDDKIGELLRTLDQTGQADNTLVIFMSDHGDYCGDHGLFAKGIPAFRGAYHVPMIMRWPKGLAGRGRTVDEFISLADIAPTLTQLAGKSPDPQLSGRSLVPFINGQTPADWRDAMFTQCNGVEVYYTQRSAFTKSHKYVFNGFDFDELYDLENDPHEMRNLAADPRYDTIKRDLGRRLWRFAASQDDTAMLGYITTMLADFGPSVAFETDR